MDSAPVHKSVLTMKVLDKIGVSVLFNQPETPDLNMAELFIRDLKSKLKKSRGEPM